jgi:hypothetical protein
VAAVGDGFNSGSATVPAGASGAAGVVGFGSGGNCAGLAAGAGAVTGASAGLVATQDGQEAQGVPHSHERRTARVA